MPTKGGSTKEGGSVSEFLETKKIRAIDFRPQNGGKYLYLHTNAAWIGDCLVGDVRPVVVSCEL